MAGQRSTPSSNIGSQTDHTPAAKRSVCWVAELGQMEYGQACRLQEELVRAKRQGFGIAHPKGFDAAHPKGLADDFLLLLEHPPVITIGRSGGATNILASREVLEQEGVAVWESPRGGDVTYHGPGQLIGYPILDLRRQGKDIRRYLRLLEEAIIGSLREYGVEGERREGLRGIWVAGRKICALGVRVSGWMTSHGFALNLDPNLDHFRLIRPCGIEGEKITSLRELLGGPIDGMELREKVVFHFGQLFGLEMKQIVGGPRVWEFPETGENSGGRFLDWCQATITARS